MELSRPEYSSATGDHTRTTKIAMGQNATPGRVERLPGSTRYPHLFSPLRIGRLALPDRFAMAPMTTNYAAPDGSVTPELCDYLAARARGGYSLIVTENMGVHPSGRVMPRMVMADDDRDVEGLARLAEAIRVNGGRSIAQISHCGRQTKSKFTGMPLVAPSAIPCPRNREMPRALSLDEVAAMENAFVAAARRIETAGYDGVEIHAAHGYLAGSFLSAYSNRRDDRYGGSLENRMRFLLNIVDGIRRTSDITLTVRISAEEFVENGNTLEQAVVIARALEARGVSGISVSVGVYETFNTMSMLSGEIEGRWLPVAGAIAHEVGIPVFGVGRIRRVEVAEAAIATGQCAVPLFGRAAIADAELPRKVREGREDDVLVCVSCNVCLGRATRPETICPVNPAVGRDRAVTRRLADPSAQPLRIAIAGSCLAALTAAWIAAQRGHRVTIYETDPVIGGMVAWRGAVPRQGEYAELVESALRRARQSGARILRRAPAAGEFDRLWATRRYQPGATGTPSCYDVLKGAVDFGEPRALHVHGGDLAGAETAVKLADKGHRLDLSTSKADICMDAHPGFRMLYRRILAEYGVQVLCAVGRPEPRPGATLIAGPESTAGAAQGSDADWIYPYAAAGVPDVLIDEAYEAGQMTEGVYAAVKIALEA